MEGADRKTDRHRHRDSKTDRQTERVEEGREKRGGRGITFHEIERHR